jgi:acyl carrier protein
MEKNEIISQVQVIFRDILDNEDIILTNETTANDIDEWDSLTHIQLIVAMEKYFKLRFTSTEIRNWKNIGEMCEGINSKIGLNA